MTDDELDELLAALSSEVSHNLAGMVVDFVCADCGRRCTTPGDWERRPVCCGWEMVDLVGSVRPAADAGAGP
jgi:hypothetical protein